MNSEEKKPGSRVVTWIFVGLFAVSLIVNIFTCMSIRGMRRTLGQMREPVSDYYVNKLDRIERNVDALVAAHPEKITKKDRKRMEKLIDNSRELWEKTARSTGTRWVRIYWKAQRSLDQTQDAYDKLLEGI